jgi:hypothetical protein
MSESDRELLHAVVTLLLAEEEWRRTEKAIVFAELVAARTELRRLAGLEGLT